MEFLLFDWAAYANGLTSHSDWLRWAEGMPQLPAPMADVIPSLPEMPALMRRRIDRLGRLACHVAYACKPLAEGSPMVFASRYGSATRSLDLLGELVKGEALSPTSFGLSVHNAISALYSIASGHTHNTVVIAAGRATAAAALTEAAALLADGAPEVLVVYYEAPLPGDYAVFEDEAACEYAWAWRLASSTGVHAPSAALARISLATDSAEPPSSVDRWPAGLAILRQMLHQLVSTDARSPEAPLPHDRADPQWTGATCA